jgi:antitoxin (DNA-binding transcriptional repressor) of toxin-antitoxin stability system
MTDIEQLARDRKHWQAQKENVEAQIAHIDAQLIDAVEAGGRILIDGEPAYRIVATRGRIDPQKLQAAAPAALVMASTVTTTSVDVKKLQSLMPPALVDTCRADTRVSVRDA